MDFGPAISGFATGALNLFIGLGSIVLIGAFIAGGFFWYSKQKKYSEFICVIFDTKGNQSKDRGGIFVDGVTKNKRLYLQKSNVGLSPDNIPYKREGLAKVVYLLQTGLKNFQFINMDFEANDAIQVSEEDVNWAINAYERQKKMLQNNLLLQILPYALFGLVVVGILVLFIYLFKKFDVFAQVAESINQAAQALAQAKTGTTLIK